MKLTLTLIISVFVAFGIVTLGYTIYQSYAERARLTAELETKIKNVAEQNIRIDSLFFCREGKEKFTLYHDSIIKDHNLMGIAIYCGKDSLLTTDDISPLLDNAIKYIPLLLFTNKQLGVFLTASEHKIYQYIRPFKRQGGQAAAVIIYADAEYIDRSIEKLWMHNMVKWIIEASVISLLIFIIIKWSILSRINQFVALAKAMRTGNIEYLEKHKTAKFLAPLQHEIENIARAIQEAKTNAEEEARLRTSAETIWTPERLKVEVSNLLQNNKMIVVSNREPYMHIYDGKEIKCIVPASGMITAMEPILKACSGLWIASGTGDADRETVDKDGKIPVPPEDPKYTLKRIWLARDEEEHFYYGFSNEGLWPLCHIAHTRPTFRIDDWNYYRKVNEKFAREVLLETGDEEQPFILIQDFHFALLPDLIKKEKPGARVAIFWHIPWPNPESFGICPWQAEILKGMLGADLIGFHTQYHCNHFLETVNRALESRVSWEDFSIKIGNHTTYIKPFPISISFTLRDYDAISLRKDPAEIMSDHGISASLIGIGVDRIDYTKGLIEKFQAIERFFEKYPEYIGRFTFVQIGAPSRTFLKSYSDMVSAVEHEAERINTKLRSKNWKPILLLKRHHSHEEIIPFYSSANFCMVTSLHDGMNLVAKEFVASRNQNDGTLILSRFAGASQELQGAIVINPYDIEKSADAIKTALEMSLEEQIHRMKQMRLTIIRQNIFSWAAEIIRTMAAINA
jgi:trehalose-6-phosphate synthase